jgi:hypothetical protein
MITPSMSAIASSTTLRGALTAAIVPSSAPPGRGIDDEAATRRGQLHQRVEVDRAGGVQGGKFAVAVPGRHVGVQAERADQAVAGRPRPRRAPAARRRCRSGAGGPRPAPLRRRRRAGTELRQAGAGAEAFAEGLRSAASARRQRLRHRLEMQRRLAPHARVLRTLAREQHRDLARGCGGRAVEDSGRQGREFAAQEGRRGASLASRSSTLRATMASVSATPAPACSQAGGQVAQFQRRRRRQPLAQPTSMRASSSARSAALHSSSSADQSCADGGISQSRYSSCVLLEHHVEVGAAETEGAAGRAARAIGHARARAAASVQQIQRRRRVGEHRVGPRHVAVRRQHPVVQRQRGLHQAGHAGAGLGVADVGLHRADDGRRGQRPPPPSAAWCSRARPCRRPRCPCRGPRTSRPSTGRNPPWRRPGAWRAAGPQAAARSGPWRCRRCWHQRP